MKKNFCIVVILILSLQLYGQQSQKFSPGAEIQTSKTIAELTSFESILFIFQGSAHSVFHFKNFKRRLQKTFRKSNLTLGFDFDLETQNALKADIEALPKRINNPTSFDLICYVKLINMKGWDHALYKKRKQSYTLELDWYQQDQLKRQTTIDVRTYWTISTQNKAVSKLILEEILP